MRALAAMLTRRTFPAAAVLAAALLAAGLARSGPAPVTEEQLATLAAAIPNSAQNKQVRAYAIAQAQWSAETAARLAEAAQPQQASSTPPPASGIYVAAGADLQAAVDAAPDGAKLTLGPGVHPLPPAGLDLSGKSAIRLEGDGGVGFNEGGRWGTVLRATVPGQAAIVDDGGGAVKHAGPELSHLTVHAAAPDVTGVHARMVNHGRLERVSFQGTFRVAVDLDIPVDTYPAGDAAYWELDGVKITVTQPDAVGVRLGDGGVVWITRTNFNMTGAAPVGVLCERGTVNVTQSKFNHAGRHILTRGTASTIIGNDFETWGTDHYAVEVERPGGFDGAWHRGARNKVVGNTFTPHDTPARAVRFGPGTYQNEAALNTVYGNDAASFADESAAGWNRLEAPAWD